MSRPTSQPAATDHEHAITRLAELGPFFAVDTHEPTSPITDPWRPMAELVRQPAVLRARIADVRAALAAAAGRDEIELRVATSVTQLGLVARLIAPVLGFAVATGQLLDVELERLWWQATLGGAFPLSFSTTVSANAGARDIAEKALDGPIAAIVAATSAASPISAKVLWGNVGSAINGAVTMITRQQPSLSERARTLGSDLIARLPVKNNGRVGPGYRRTDCCLIYRLAENDHRANICGDCVLHKR